MRIVCVGAGPAGLYFAILSKLRDPGATVQVRERNPQGVTYGWGVTLCDDLLDIFYAGDPVSAAQIQRSMVRWRDQVVVLNGQAGAYVGPYGYAISRHRLLEILSERATGLGVDVRYECPVSGTAAEFADADLVVATDGVQSQLRRQFADEFGTMIEHGRNHYVWLGTTKEFTEFTYAFEQTAAGWIWLYAYPFDSARSTVIAECAPSTWQGLGFDRLDPDETLGELERIFARHLDGHPLQLQVRQDSAPPWLKFTWIRNRSWVHRNVALAGDAAHTAHFSLGAGTRLAIDDVAALNRQMQANGGTAPSVAAALTAYQRERIDAVAAEQRVSRTSAEWFERVQDDTMLSPASFSYAMSTTRYSNGSAPVGLPWVKHLAAQGGVGRQALTVLNGLRRRRRARQRDPNRPRATTSGMPGNSIQAVDERAS